MSGIEKKINIEEILTEIRQDIKEKGYKSNDISFDDIGLDSSIAASLEQLRIIQNVTAHRPIRSNSVFGGITVLIKKIIRKMTRFYVEPVVADQNEVNRLAVQNLNSFYSKMEDMRCRISDLEDEVKRLKENEGTKPQ